MFIDFIPNPNPVQVFARKRLIDAWERRVLERRWRVSVMLGLLRDTEDDTSLKAKEGVE